MSNLLAPIKQGKVISSGFVSIPHLPGSKMTDKFDKRIAINLVERFVNPNYVNPYNKEKIKVYITEKVDGSCDGVYKDLETGLLYPINRKGYDVRSYYKENNSNLS